MSQNYPPQFSNNVPEVGEDFQSFSPYSELEHRVESLFSLSPLMISEMARRDWSRSSYINSELKRGGLGESTVEIGGRK